MDCARQSFGYGSGAVIDRLRIEAPKTCSWFPFGVSGLVFAPAIEYGEEKRFCLASDDPPLRDKWQARSPKTRLVAAGLKARAIGSATTDAGLLGEKNAVL